MASASAMGFKVEADTMELGEDLCWVEVVIHTPRGGDVVVWALNTPEHAQEIQAWEIYDRRGQAVLSPIVHTLAQWVARDTWRAGSGRGLA